MTLRRPLIAVDGSEYFSDGPYRARWVVPMSSPPRHDAVVVVHNGLVKEICESSEQPDAIDLGDVALLPALVNVHTHLEFSYLDSPLGYPGISFPKWIQAVVQSKQDSFRNPGSVTRAINLGLEKSYQYGVSLLGEIATMPWGNVHQVRSFPEMLIFPELLGLSEDRCEFMIRNTEIFLKSLLEASRPFGISPHAPYSTSLKLLEYAMSRSKDESLCVAMHLAESIEEIELIETGGGEFREFLEGLDLQPQRYFPEPDGILNRLKLLSQCTRSLVIHGNYLSPKEIEFLRENPQMTVVYCPRTHAYFRHQEHPIEQLLRLGIRVVLGSDSCASSPDLNLWADAQAVYGTHPGIAPEQIIAMVTTHAAEAIGLQNRGSIQMGARLDLISVPTSERSIRSLFRALLESTPKLPTKKQPLNNL